MTTKPRKAVDAKVVDVDHKVEPIDAVVVGDKRSSFGRRLGLFALALLVLFFTINGYIQSAKNGEKATRANHKIDKLIDIDHNLSKTIADQTDLIRALQASQRKQNHILANHGLKTVIIPGDSSSSDGGQTSNNHPNGNKPPSHDKPKPKPGHSPNPSPSPTPSHHTVKDTVCNLTGICLMERGLNDFNRENIRPSQVRCASSNSRHWSAIFCSVASMGIAWW